MEQDIHQQLLRPPFFAIPGVDPASPLPTQMEQIDQLNTLCLQEIDANFARFHQVLTTRILPSIKKYAIASEPTRDAATFWNNFYLKAYGPSPLDADAEPTSPERDQTTYEDHTMTMESMTQSFAFEPKAGFSSTPMPRRTAGVPQNSIEESVESPFDRTERQLGALALDESEDATTPSLPVGYGFSHFSTDSSAVSPPSVVRRTEATPRRPGTPEHNDHHNRLIDMTATPLNAKFHPLQPTSVAAHGAARSRKIEGSILDVQEADEDEVTMSPFKTMTFNKLPRANAMLQAGSTPVKSQGLQDILAEMEEFDSPKVDTPKEFRRYSVAPNDLPARRLFDDYDSPGANEAGPSSGFRPRRSLANTSYGSDIQVQDDTGVIDNDVSDGDNTFSDDEDDTAAMQAHARHAAEGFELVDDSYVSEASVAYHPREGTELFGPGKEAGQRHFALHQQDEMFTYHGGRLEDAQGPESPTARR